MHAPIYGDVSQLEKEPEFRLDTYQRAIHRRLSRDRPGALNHENSQKVENFRKFSIFNI